MLNQSAKAKTKTEPLTSKGLIQVRQIQNQIRERTADGLLPQKRWQAGGAVAASPMRGHVTRWIE